MTDCLLTGVGSSNTQSAVFFFSKRQVSQINSFTSLYSSLRSVTTNTQSAVFFFSKRQVSQINSFTSLYSSLRPVTRNTSSPLYHNVTFPEQVGQSRCASTGLENHTRLLKRNVLSVKAPTGHTSITFPIKSLSNAFSIKVDISAWSPRWMIPCSRFSVN